MEFQFTELLSFNLPWVSIYLNHRVSIYRAAEFQFTWIAEFQFTELLSFNLPESPSFNFLNYGVSIYRITQFQFTKITEFQFTESRSQYNLALAISIYRCHNQDINLPWTLGDFNLPLRRSIEFQFAGDDFNLPSQFDLEFNLPYIIIDCTCKCFCYHGNSMIR